MDDFEDELDAIDRILRGSGPRMFSPLSMENALDGTLRQIDKWNRETHNQKRRAKLEKRRMMHKGRNVIPLQGNARLRRIEDGWSLPLGDVLRSIEV